MSQFIVAAASGSLTTKKKEKGAFCEDDKTYLSYKVVCVCFVSASPSVTRIKTGKRKKKSLDLVFFFLWSKSWTSVILQPSK